MREKSQQRGILNVQDLNSPENYLQGNYELEILTNPETVSEAAVLAMNETKMTLKNYGTVSLMASENLLTSIYQWKNRRLEMVDRWEMKAKTESRKLQPGEYWLVYKTISSYESESTRTQTFKVEEGNVVVLNLAK